MHLIEPNTVLSSCSILQLDSVAFSLLDVSEQNYDSVDSLNLDSNVLEELPEKLLDMKLELMFSARNNKLTDVSA